MKIVNVLAVNHDTGKCEQLKLSTMGLEFIKGESDVQILHVWDNQKVQK